MEILAPVILSANDIWEGSSLKLSQELALKRASPVAQILVDGEDYAHCLVLTSERGSERKIQAGPHSVQ